MKAPDFETMDFQMKKWAPFFIEKLKIPHEKTNRIASIIASETINIPQKSKKEIIETLSVPVSLQHRLDELKAFQGWMDLSNSIQSNPCMTRAQVIVQNYICFVYLGEACFKTLKKYLESGSITKKCCDFLLNNPVRAFRNAIAHSNWQYNDDFSGIMFWARKGDQASETMIEWKVTDRELDFWQALARCTAYTALICLTKEKD